MLMSTPNRPPGQTRRAVATDRRRARRHTRAARAGLAASALTRSAADPGSSTVAHLEENLGAALIELTPDQIQELDAAI
jgi:aryl-alcohol dehydrogenase-like predicted oxidoreductase